MSGNQVGALHLNHLTLWISDDADISEVQQINPATLREEGFSLAISGKFEGWCDLDSVCNDNILLDVCEGLTSSEVTVVVIEEWIEASLSAFGSLEQASIHEAQEAVSVSHGLGKSLSEVGIALEFEALWLHVKFGKWLEGS